MKRITLFIFAIAIGFIAKAQNNDVIRDTITGHDRGKIQINNPTSIVEAYTYDPATNRYIYTKSFDGFNITYPIILTPEQYDELVLREAMRKYYKEKMDAIEGKKEGSEQEQKNLLPRYYVNSSFFETVFGGSTIDIKPSGSVEMDLGLRYSRQNNPSLSPRNRATTSPIFDQRISLSLNGQVGTRVNVNANYDTQSTFNFQNLIKLEYEPTEDSILRKIEVGNVNLPLSSSLVRGAQSLFGVKAQFQFGKTTITGVFSQQKSQTKTVTAENGGTVQDFEIFALDYDADRHFFLSQFFRNRYDRSLRNYPFIDSRVQITRIEVWITNKQNRVNTTDNNLRNIIALQDLGEERLTNVPIEEIIGLQTIPAGFFTGQIDAPPANANNRFNPNLINSGGGLLNNNIREMFSVSTGFNGVTVNEGTDYAKLENARKLSSNEFTFHPQLGYISLNQKLANDEILAVAYQYIIGGQVFQVGEFGTDGVENTIANTNTPGNQIIITQSLVLKLLKSSLTVVSQPIWNLMMKNIYHIPGGSQLQQDGFRFNILYTDPSPLNFISPVQGSTVPPETAETTFNTPLLKVFNLDKLDYNNDPQPRGDGFFDFIPDLTVNTQNGLLIFTTIEPFGKHLFTKLSSNSAMEDYRNPNTYNPDQRKYVFNKLYNNTQTAAMQSADKNKFQLKGKFRSNGGDGIPIGALNVPQGSVVVRAGGRILVEGIDYTVNYQFGRVQILDPTLQNSNTPIEISLENNSVFGQQTRNFVGLNIEHKFTENFLIEGTVLRLTEKPLTQKSNYGQESVNNTILGMNTNYSTEVPFFTRLVNMLPNVDTDAPSNFSLRGEFAYLKPDTPRGDRFQGESTIYLDNFESAQTAINMSSPLAWSLASAPIGYGGELSDTGLDSGYKRAKLAWYTVDPIFYTTQRPSGISALDISFNRTRRIFSQELFPLTDIVVGQSTVISTLDLTYFPTERGPYNYNPMANGNQLPLSIAGNNWGGIMRAINLTDFEQSNIEYIEFWLMDPYFGNQNDPGNPNNQSSRGGQLVFNLGQISEDILKDGRKFYENGLPTSTQGNIITTQWGKVPASQSLIYAFDVNEGNRIIQDVGLDGLNDAEEATLFPQFAGLADPSADNYTYYLSAQGDVINRYRDYNGIDGNSPVALTNNDRGSSTIPDVEDINRDNTMNTVNAYYKYIVDIKPSMAIGDRYVADIRLSSAQVAIGGNASETVNARWIQFKIPIKEVTDANREGLISDFRSIQFMRIFMTGFEEQTTLRFGTLDLIRGDWRRYTNVIDPVTEGEALRGNTAFDVLTVSIQENSNRVPIRYVSPPGVEREQLFDNNSVIDKNEQALSLRIYKADNTLPGYGGLEPNDARGIFRNVDFDMRQYNKYRMFLHAESLPRVSPGVPNGETNPLKDDEMIAFVRFGNDFTRNFYQIEIPLKVTQEGASLDTDIWPEANEIDLAMALLAQLKILALNNKEPLPSDGIFFRYEDELDGSLANKPNKLRLGIKGNPNFGHIRTMMLGLKNGHNQEIRGEVWFNEMRLSGMDNKGGMAAVVSMDANFADIANTSLTGAISTIGFGALDQGPNQRSLEDSQQYNLLTNINLGKLLPNRWGINVPFNYNVGEHTISPKYDPFYQDLKLQTLLDLTTDKAERDNIKDRAIDYTKTKGINFIGVNKQRAPQQKQHFYDPENLTLSYAFNETKHHDYEIESLLDQNVRAEVDYNYTIQAKNIEPFKNSKYLKKNSYWKLISDFNFNYLPSNVTFTTDINRQFNRQQFRQVDVEGIGLDPLYRRNYKFNYRYGFNYSLTKSLRFNYNVTTNNIIDTYSDINQNPNYDDYTIWDDYWDIGQTNQHNQQLIMNYDLPINKIPILSFIKSTYTYTADYNWQRSSLAFSNIEAEDGNFYNLGNTIQNANSHRLNVTFNMDMFYKYIGFTKTPQKKVSLRDRGAPGPGQRITPSSANQTNKERSLFLDGLIGVVTSVKNIQVNYMENNGTFLPGFLPGVGFLGTLKPTSGFVFGSQSDVRYEAAKRGWLTEFPDFNQNFTQQQTKKLNITAQLEIFPDLKIDLTSDRDYSNNFSEQYDVIDGIYNSRSPNYSGNFSISTVLIKTAFSRSDENGSVAFNSMRDNRLTVANRLAVQHYGSTSFPTDGEGFPIGFGRNSQAVLLPSFLAAYQGTSASSISLSPFRSFPIPNGTIKYTGLMRYAFFKDKFRRISLQTNYRSSYTVNQFSSNFEYDQNPNGLDNAGNFFNELVISNINLVEQFNPLIRVDFELKNSFRVLTELRKDRTLSMSFVNSLLTEVQGMEYIIGLGYRIKDVIIVTTLADNPTNTIKSDINIRADLSMRRNNTIVRNLEYDNNQLVGGQELWGLKLTADYTFSKSLTTIFFYDHSFSKAVISTSFPITNIRAGFTVRYNFGN